MVCVINSYGQEIVEKNINSNAKLIHIEFDQIDQIELFNAKEASNVRVRAEGAVYSPSFQLQDVDGHVLLKDNEKLESEALYLEDKACIEEPNYTSYQIYIPENRTVYISFSEGNFYATNFKGELNLKAEDGVIKLNNMVHPLKLSLNSGSVIVRSIRDTQIDAETNLGILVSDLDNNSSDIELNQLIQTIGKSNNSMFIRTIQANIYLYGYKD